MREREREIYNPGLQMCETNREKERKRETRKKSEREREIEEGER